MQLPSWPRTPDALHTVPFNDHGTMLYMPTLPGHLFYFCFDIGVPSVFIAAIAVLAARRLNRKG